MIFKLQQIKKIREQRSSTELAKAKEQQLSAEQSLVNAQASLAQYITWQQEEIKRRYQEIIGSSMQLNDLSDFNYEISTLNIKQVELEQAITMAEQTLAKQQGEVKRAERAYTEAQAQCQKFSELGDLEIARQQKQANLLEDQALDDFKVRPAIVIG